jgi:hypothetical protein
MWERKNWLIAGPLLAVIVVVAVVIWHSNKIEANAKVASAIADAGDEDQNLQFTSLEIKAVQPDGSVVGDDGGIKVWFRDPAREQRDGHTCRAYEIRAWYGNKRSSRASAKWTYDNCGPLAKHAPKCTVTQIWQRAIKAGASNSATATTVSAQAQKDGGIHWWLTIDESKWDFNDDC